MELSHENRRTRWWILMATWALTAVLLSLHTRVIEDYNALNDQLGRRGAAGLHTPLQRTIPTLFADTQTWTRHALALLETDAWRIRFTDIDNAPHGRPVHWNSAFAWLIAGSGRLRQAVTGEPLPLAMERSLGWFNVPLFLGVIVLFAAWTAKRAGAAAGVFVALAMMGGTEFSNGFAPSFVDHHGVLTVANFGLVLGIAFMGAGWLAHPGNRDTTIFPATIAAARRAAIFSALSGAIGMWVSAASVAPGIAIAGLAGLVATLWQGRAARAAGAMFDAGLWRLWGRVGAAASVLFYLLEYAPNHIELRLEVNHPLLALAWWGGSELIAQLGEWHLGIPARPPAWRLLGPLAAVAAAPVTVLIAGTKVFVIRDPLVLQLADRVAEGLPLPQAITLLGWVVLWARVPWFVATLIPAVILILRRPAADRLLLAFGALTVVAFVAMGCFQIRFFANVGGPEIMLFLVVFSVLFRAWSMTVRWTVVAAVALLLCVSERVYRIIEVRQAVRQRAIDPADALQPLYRDIAAALRRSQPQGEIILLTNPNASTSIGYFGRFKTIGTLYWENLDGMKAAAAMHSATSLPGARALMLARRVTHVAVISESSFVRDYFELAHPPGQWNQWEQGIAFQLFAGRNVPLWLEQIPYQPPDDIRLPQLRVVLFKTRFGSPAAEEAFAAATHGTQRGDIRMAESALDQAVALDPTAPEFWKLKGELLLARGATTDAEVAIERMLRVAPSSHQAELARSAAGVFYEKGAHAAAIRLYRSALAYQYQPMAASNLAWILATSHDDALRDGKAAVALARRLVTDDPKSYHFLSALAAALAETGALTEAVTAASQALELARASGNAGLASRAEERLRAYQAGRPWRQ